MKLSAFAAIAALVASPASAQEKEADVVIAKAIAAMGGIERIRALNSLVMRGYHYEGEYHQEQEGARESNATMIRMRPNLRLVGATQP